MLRAKIIREELIEEDTSFFSVYIETKNASQLFLSEGEDMLGTLAIAMPQQKNLIGSPVSSILLGDRNLITSRLLAELLAEKKKKISLVSIFSKSVNEKKAVRIFRKLLDKTLKKVNNEN